MQKLYRCSQLNIYVVHPVYKCQLGFFADGKILHCDKHSFL